MICPNCKKETLPHRNSRYIGKGCRCDICKAAHVKASNAWRDANKKKTNKAR